MSPSSRSRNSSIRPPRWGGWPQKGVRPAVYHDAREQRNQARLQRDRARKRLKDEVAIVDRFLTGVSESPELRAKGAERLRKDLLKQAVAYYEALVREEDSDPELG